jgi:serine/threonine protein kinase
MSLPLGTRFGPYEILTPLGSGGMGEVYRARDTRLRREVAIKIISSSLSTDREHLARFEQEARTAGSLNHPNILAIFDIGAHDGLPYLVSELLEGQTLRDRLNEAALSLRKTIDYALQVARGLAAAHEKGIVHRDLKPENIFITRDGRVKILDFGLAKLTHHQHLNDIEAETPTLQVRTGEGVIVGTVSYMSPEQVRGDAVDHRSDIFSFGSTLYEMLARKRAFSGDSAVETMNAILKEDPPELGLPGRVSTPSVAPIVRHCLEKSPEERFQSAHDLAFDLEMLSEISGATQVAGSRPRSTWLRWVVPGVLLIVAALSAYFVGKKTETKPTPFYHQLTFRRGTVRSARFAPDGRTVIYSAAWNGNPLDIFSTRVESPESRSLGLENADLLGISSSGEMALLVNRKNPASLIKLGTLARMPLGGGAPREISDNIQQADWSPDGSSLAVVRYFGGRSRLEFPMGNILNETAGYLSHPRISPDGKMVAFMDHQTQWDNRGWIAVVDLAGNKKILSGEWTYEDGLAWSPEGNELWFTASKAGETVALYAVTLSGHLRVVSRMPVNLMLHDISRTGSVLLMTYHQSASVSGLPPGEHNERDLSWFDNIGVWDLSRDGRAFIFQYYGEGSGPNYSTYFRKTDGSPAIRLGDGAAQALSPDAKQVLSIVHSPPELVVLPIGAGEPIRLERHGIEDYGDANWLPDGRGILFTGREPGHAARCYVQDIDSGNQRTVTPEGITGTLISPDGKLIVASDPQRQRFVYPLEGGSLRPIIGLSDEDQVIRWSADGSALFVFQRTGLPTRVYRLNLATGRKDLWKEVMPSDTAGIVGSPRILLTPDGNWYVYHVARYLSELHIVDG